MRIISGKFKGKKIFLPEDELTRPLRDMVKESIFNILKHSNKFDISIENSYVLDLFSGSGSFGLEALSRGANNITFIENHIPAYQLLNKNIKNLNCQKNCNIFNQNCFDYLENNTNEKNKFDIIFLDPPFREKKINELLDNILKKKILKKKGIIIIHRHKKDNIELTDKFNNLEQRLYGISKITFGN